MSFCIQEYFKAAIRCRWIGLPGNVENRPKLRSVVGVLQKSVRELGEVAAIKRLAKIIQKV